jgi:hypothetical protein
MTESPLFIIGTERSGSNLLRLILNTHRRIAIPHPPHVVRYFAPLEAAYGDVSRSEEAFAALVDDILAFVRMHIYSWDMPLDCARVLREAEPRDSFGVTTALFDQYSGGSALALQPADDQRAVQIRQFLPGVLLAGLRAEQQALSSFVHGALVASPGRTERRFSGFFIDSC